MKTTQDYLQRNYGDTSLKAINELNRLIHLYKNRDRNRYLLIKRVRAWIRPYRYKAIMPPEALQDIHKYVEDIMAAFEQMYPGKQLYDFRIQRLCKLTPMVVSNLEFVRVKCEVKDEDIK